MNEMTESTQETKNAKPPKITLESDDKFKLYDWLKEVSLENVFTYSQLTRMAIEFLGKDVSVSTVQTTFNSTKRELSKRPEPVQKPKVDIEAFNQLRYDIDTLLYAVDHLQKRTNSNATGYFESALQRAKKRFEMKLGSNL